MKGNKTGWMIGAVLSFLGTGALGGTCEISYTRTACPGQQEVSFQKCSGKASCSETKEATAPAQCKQLATDACENKRTNITKSKVIIAKFDGAAIKTDGGDTDFCKAYSGRANEFDKC